jgi:ATP-dependent DNA helicase 2 subunit 1
MAQFNNKGQISKQTVAVLRQYLSARDKPTVGLKTDLVDRVQKYLEGIGL